MEPIKNETNKTSGLIDRTYCNYEYKGTSVYELPWLVGILAYGGELIGSGSLINTRYVLTSAELAYVGPYLPGFIDVVGNINLKTNRTNCKNITASSIDECFNFEKYGIQQIIIHPLYKIDYKESTFDTDNVALLRLRRTVTYNEYMHRICLPTFQTVTPKPGDTLYLSDWIVKYDAGLDKETLNKKIPTTSITRAECQEKLKKCNSTRPNFYYTLYDKYECIQTDVNRSDLSVWFGHYSAVMSFNNNKWKMEGILVNFRQTCEDEPLIYLRISPYLDWIEENMRSWN